MALQDTVEKLQTATDNIYDKLEEKGATVPTEQTLSKEI